MSITKKFQSAKKNYKVTFSIPVDVAPNAKTVQVIGEFNNWDMRTAPSMKASKTEYAATLELNPGTYQFRYLIDGLRWENDFAADNYVSSPFAGINNSVLILPSAGAATGAKRGPKPKAEKAAAEAPKAATGAKRGPKPKAEKAAVEAPKAATGAKRGPKPKAEKAAAEAPKAATGAKRGPKPKAEKAAAEAPKAATGAKRGPKPKTESSAAPKPASTGKRGRPKKA
ncbi:MAG: isoamylase early set domain-containing protein [Saprospiraceae bacterium]|nr:isoamylase early set domain-containing protein [Saprospiraceae bacterium]